MVTVTIDMSDAKVFLEEARREGGGRLRALWEWSRGFAGRGLEALLGMELTVLLERERAAGITNWRNGYRSRTLSLSGAGAAWVLGAARPARTLPQRTAPEGVAWRC
jgi:hypothetical protein